MGAFWLTDLEPGGLCSRGAAQGAMRCHGSWPVALFVLLATIAFVFHLQPWASAHKNQFLPELAVASFKSSSMPDPASKERADRLQQLVTLGAASYPNRKSGAEEMATAKSLYSTPGGLAGGPTAKEWTDANGNGGWSHESDLAAMGIH